MFHFIDDEIMIRELLEIFISNAGYESMSFESGNQYIEYLNSAGFKSPTAVISDVTMPGINGYDLALKIREQHPFQKIILTTGNSNDAHHPRAASQLCYTLEKPFRAENFIALINAMAACDKKEKTGQPSEYFKQCEFGIDHDCPFHAPKHLTP